MEISAAGIAGGAEGEDIVSVEKVVVEVDVVVSLPSITRTSCCSAPISVFGHMS